MRDPATYPFIPRSTRSLVPGQFWAIPLSCGDFACGRVLQIGSPVAPRVHFLAGLMDWFGSEEPSDTAIAGSHLVAQGAAHLKTIIETGGAIIGIRSLEDDGIEPLLCRDQAYGPGSMVLRGFEVLRPATPSEFELPALRTWGYNVIGRLAERHASDKSSNQAMQRTAGRPDV